MPIQELSGIAISCPLFSVLESASQGTQPAIAGARNGLRKLMLRWRFLNLNPCYSAGNEDIIQPKDTWNHLDIPQNNHPPPRPLYGWHCVHQTRRARSNQHIGGLGEICMLQNMGNVFSKAAGVCQRGFMLLAGRHSSLEVKRTVLGSSLLRNE